MKIAVNLHAGLGNKLFQIAFLIGLRERFRKDPRFNFSDFKYEILHYMREPHETVNWSYFIRDLSELTQADLVNAKIASYCENHFAPGKYVDYEKMIGEAYSQSIDLLHFRGYFQSVKFFEGCEDVIREKFRCPKIIQRELVEKYPEIDTRGVFIHVRRGDLCGKKLHDFQLFENRYYHRALTKFKSVENRKIFVCSDDIEWCRNNLSELLSEDKDMCFVEDNEINTLWVMSLCRFGGIMSNSSFSWWGSYLNESPDKIIVTTNKFLTDERYDTSDHIHPSFIVESVTP